MDLEYYRHTWMNNPTSSKRLCTRCGCTKEKGMELSNGTKGDKYTKNGETYEGSAPLCCEKSI